METSEHNDDVVPNQRVGKKFDTLEEFKAESDTQAKEVFERAVARLLDVNRWGEICGAMSANFTLTDKNGNEKGETVEVGDHFKIDIPGPGPRTGDGYDWVEVEEIEDARNPSGDEERVTVRVRPSPSPDNASPDVAHFFSNNATSSFRVCRIGDTVTAEVHGRNETPNTSTDDNVDKVRNAMVGTGATAGMSFPQWKSLVKGLLEDEPEA